MPDQPDQPERTATELLAAALEHLTPAERQRVNTWIYTGLGRGGLISRLHNTENHSGGLDPMPAHIHSALHASAAAAGSLRGDSQVVPVRLPSELHATLRAWSAAHGFSMATIVRGLVTRFLDDQGATPPADEPAG
ncbi:MAG TPA: hypothetical protein VHW44_04300 [Pseudonocardiaceae bacterium]|jgi:hypothetical protein|nr:hypothetical protein [Pseudonocardiaceae bacterium]